MAIKPLEERLDSILPNATQPDVAAFLANENQITLEVDPVDATDAEPVEVAVLGNLGRLFSKEAVKSVVKKADEALQGPPIPPAPTPRRIPKAEPVEAKDLQKTEQQLEAFEGAIDAAPTAGTPPDTMVNLNRIDGPNDFKQAVESLVTSSGIEIKRMTFEETLAAAKAKGFDYRMISELEALKKQYGDLPPDMVRLRLAAYQNNREFYDLARRAYTETDNQELMAQLLQKLNLQTAINEAYITVRTRAAQGTAVGNLQITEGMAKGFLDEAGNVKIPAINDAEMKKMLADPTVSENLKVLVEKFVQLTDEAGREELINKVSKVGVIRDLWDRTWKNGLLSATGTHIINLTSNATFLASSVATRQLASLYGILGRGVGLQAEVEAGEAAAMVAGMVHAWREAMSLGWTALKTGTTREMREGSNLLSDAGQKLEGQYQVFNAKNYGFENEALVKGMNFYANFVTLLGGRPIMAMDEVFKLMGYRAELYAHAFRLQAQAKRTALAAGKTVDEAEEIGLLKMGEILGTPPAEIDELAKDFSHMITFSRKLTGSAKSIQDFAQENLIGRVMLPFVKTPVWVTSESMQHSLLAPFSKQWRTDIAAGGAKRELAMAKWGMGSLIMVGIGSYVADGRITGGGPGNQALKQTYMASGWRPYSFVFQSGEWDQEFVDYLKFVQIDASIGKDGRLYVPFRGIDPIAGPLSMIADTVEYARYEDDQDKVGQVVLGAVYGLYSYVGQLPFMTALSGVTGAFSQTIPNPKVAFKGAIDAFVKQAAGYAVEGSPAGIFSSARGMTARAVDPVKRDIRGDPNAQTGVKGWDEFWNYYVSRTPGLSETLPESHDYLGEIEYRGDPANPWLSSMSGIRYSESKQRQADKIIIALGVPIKKPDANIEVNVNGNTVRVKLDPVEHQFMLRQLALLTNGRNEGIQEAIVSMAASPGFEQADKNEKQNSIKEVYAEFVQMAKIALIEQKPGVLIRAEKAAAKLPVYGNPK